MRPTKQQVVEELRKRGYPAYLESGLVMVGVSPNEPGAYTKVSEALKEIGYNASWGYGVKGEPESYMGTEMGTFVSF